ncbi:MAG TPA: Gx transporter family protein [Clostridia bacterium]|nr:Gx transporter family protein [Clostridia bacterium]
MRKLATLSLLTSLAVILHTVEAWLPIPYLLPGAKLGFANIVAVYTLDVMGIKDALLIGILRTTISGLLTGTFLTMGFFLSFSGAIVSTLAMGAAFYFKRNSPGLTVIGISVLGATVHNLTQLLVASLIVRHTGLLFYLPYLLLFGVPTGILVGILAKRLITVTAALYRR